MVIFQEVSINMWLEATIKYSTEFYWMVVIDYTRGPVSWEESRKLADGPEQEASPQLPGKGAVSAATHHQFLIPA